MVVAAVLVLLGLPLIVALALGFVVGIPLGFVVLRPLNRRVSAGLAARRERRDRQRAELRAQLRGDRDPTADPGRGGADGSTPSQSDGDETRGEDSQ